MLPGFNHNVRYNDTVYHVQTEDSGIKNPHIITHLFYGGNILETRRTSYADIVHSERLKDMLVELMQDQHKRMLKDLINGSLDEKISKRSANAGKLNGPAPLNVEAGGQERVSVMMSGPREKPPLSKAAPGAQKSPGTQNDALIDAAELEKAFDAQGDQTADSLFEDEATSDHSLDEVILSYLSQDRHKKDPE